MTRRDFLGTAASAAVVAPRLNAAEADVSYQKMGLNTYCLRAFKWTDKQLLDYAASLKLDGVFLQDSLDPDRDKLQHWREIGAYARQLKLHIETGVGAVLPHSSDAVEASRQQLLLGLARSKACGSPLVRCLLAGDRAHLPPVSDARNISAMVKLLKSVEPQFREAGLKVAIENHKDLQAWETREVIEGAGKDWVGSYLDTGNPVFVVENPLTTVEVLGPYALCVHLRDSVVYECPRGAMVQWVPLGQGDVDFHEIVQRVHTLKPDVYVYIKPITGRPPHFMPYLESAFWKGYPDARAFEFARFVALAKQGRPYEKAMVVEDVPGRKAPEPFVAALQYQQREHMEESIDYAKKSLNLGVRWRAGPGKFPASTIKVGSKR
jgi:sugar phosphate isomerase/epimerase